MNKQQLAQKIWASANQMRSKIEANEYKDYILGFIFYKYLSDKEVKFLKENDYDNELLKTVSEEDAETVEWIQKNIGYFIAYKDLFSTWLTMGKDFDVSNVRDALSAFSRLISSSHKRVFEKVYSSNNLETGSIGLNKYGKACISPVYSIFEPTGIADSDFLGRRLVRKDFINAMVKWRQGVIYGQWRIHESDFLKIEISVPSVEEQRKIGAYLDQLDNLITLHQRQPFLQSPPDISLIVQLTPPFYTFSWEQRKLGDMMNVTSVKRIHQSDWTDSGVRFLRARDIVAAAKNEEPDDYLYISKEKYEEYSTLSGKVGVSDLLVTGVGTIGVPYLVRNLEPLYFKDGNIIWFQNLDKIDGKFLFYSFSAEQIQGFINESAGIGTVGTYTIESGKKTPISLPNQIEQAKVGEFFQQLDNLITLHQRQTIVYAVIRSIRKVILAERQYFAPPMVRKSP